MRRSCPGHPHCHCSGGLQLEAAQEVQEVFMTPKFRVYTNTDIIGVELAGALKNVLPWRQGVCDGLGCGDNTKATLMTRAWQRLPAWG